MSPVDEGARHGRRAQIAARILLVAVLGGGLALWAKLRAPHELQLDLDLTAALPGDLAEVDVVVTRDGHALARVDERYGPQGAPGTVHVQLKAQSGEAEVEATVVDRTHLARRTRARVTLEVDAPAVVRVDPGAR